MRTTGRMALALAPSGLVLLIGAGIAHSATAGPAPVVITWSDSTGFGPATAAPSPGQAVAWANTATNPLMISRTAAPTVAITVPAGATSSPIVLAASPGALVYGGDSRVFLSGAVHSGAVVVPPSPSASASSASPAVSSPAPARTTPAPKATRSPSPVRSAVLLLPSALAEATASPSPDGSPLPALDPIPLDSAPPISAQPPQVAADPLVEDSPSPSPSPSEVVVAAVGTGTPGIAGERVPDRRLGLPISVGLVLALGVGSAVVRAARRRP